MNNVLIFFLGLYNRVKLSKTDKILKNRNEDKIQNLFACLQVYTYYSNNSKYICDLNSKR